MVLQPASGKCLISSSIGTLTALSLAVLVNSAMAATTTTPTTSKTVTQKEAISTKKPTPEVKKPAAATVKIQKSAPVAKKEVKETKAVKAEPAAPAVQEKKKAESTAASSSNQEKKKSDTAESKAPVAPSFVLTPEEKASLKPETIAELQKMAIALQFETNSISQELQDDQEEMVKDIAMLWQAAVERSGSIRFALEKLSRQDATGKPLQGPSVGRKLAQGAARVAGVAGSMVTANPAGMIGGGLVEQMLLEDPTSSAYQRVTDADMVILAKEVEGLQSRVIDLYYRYRQSKERLEMAQEANQNLGKYYDQFEQKSPDPTLETILNSLYESAKQDENQAKQAFATSRNELGLVVGPDALKALETVHSGDKEGENEKTSNN